MSSISLLNGWLRVSVYGDYSKYAWRYGLAVDSVYPSTQLAHQIRGTGWSDAIGLVIILLPIPYLVP